MIPQASPRASYLAHKDEIDAAVARVLAGGQYITGFETIGFEKEFGEYLGGLEVIGTGSGTEAIHLALRALGIGNGDVVITVSQTAGATVTAIELAGAIPALVDIHPRSFTIATNTLEESVAQFRCVYGDRLKAIIVVHLYGNPADMIKVKEISSRERLLVIEDCAQAHGASIDHQKVGTWGDIAAFSFYPTKNLAAAGDGGAVATANRQIAEKARMIHEYGWKERYVSFIPGMNTRLDELQAAILRVKLKYLDVENSRRRKIAEMYSELLPEGSVITPQVTKSSYHVYHQYVIRTQKRDELRKFLEANSIQTGIHYPLPVHLQPAYKQRLLTNGPLSVTESVCHEILSLPVFPQLTDEQVLRVGQTILEWTRDAKS